MNQQQNRFVILLLLGLWAGFWGLTAISSGTPLLSPETACAQEKEEEAPSNLLFDPEKPLVLLAIKSGNSLVENLQGLLARVGREDLKDKVTPQFLFNEETLVLKYATPDKPIGMMLYWNPANLSFSPQVCVFHSYRRRRWFTGRTILGKSQG